MEFYSRSNGEETLENSLNLKIKDQKMKKNVKKRILDCWVSSALRSQAFTLRLWGPTLIENKDGHCGRVAGPRHRDDSTLPVPPINPSWSCYLHHVIAICSIIEVRDRDMWSCNREGWPDAPENIAPIDFPSGEMSPNRPLRFIRIPTEIIIYATRLNLIFQTQWRCWIFEKILFSLN